MNEEISPHIFRAYDIRGIYNKTITPELFYKIGLAAGTYVKEELQGSTLAVGGDIRQSSSTLLHAFVSGVTASGIDVTFFGITSFGQTLFSGCKLKQDLITFITASHLPPEWNGVKFYYSDGVGLPEKDLMNIRDRTLNAEYTAVDWEHLGMVSMVESKKDYTKFFQSKFSYSKKISVAVDCGGASTVLSAPEVFPAVGLSMVPVFCTVDPKFTMRPSDPKPENLTKLVQTVKEKKCDFGIAFDGDGDRSVLVDNTGRVLSADQTGIILGKYGIAKKRGTVIVNVECSKAVSEQLEPLGFQVKQIEVGHTFLTLHAKKENSPLGIESSGHLILPEYFLFDDAMVIPLKIAEILDQTNTSLSTLVDEIPQYPRYKEEIDCADEIKFSVMDQLKQQLQKEYDNTNTLDGVRVNLKEGWVLVRASNTSPILRLTVEGETQETVDAIAKKFRQRAQKIISKHTSTQ